MLCAVVFFSFWGVLKGNMVFLGVSNKATKAVFYFLNY